jgi:hypothetical protein
MGAGRSGSTILGVALGNCSGIFYAGELEAWLRRSGVPNFSGMERERFWSAVREDVGGEDLFGEEPWRYIEYSLAPLRLRGGLLRGRLRGRYRQIARELYRAIASKAGATHIVDTSHYPLRARELQQLPDIDLYLIYLARDPQDVAASFNRRDVTNRPKSPLATNAYLFFTHMLSVHVFLRHPRERRLLLRYEDLIADPRGTLRQILDWLSISTSLPDFSSLSTGIAFQGNRLLESPRIALRERTAQEPLAARHACATRLLQLPWRMVLSALRPQSGTQSACR